MYFSGECARVYVMCTFDVSQHHSCRTIHLWMTVVAVPTVSHVRLFGTPWTAAGQAFLSFIISQSLLKLMSTESVMPSNHFILCCPLLLLPSIFPSIKVFAQNQFFTSGGETIGASASASVLLMNIRRVDFFRIDWFDFLAVQETFKKFQFLESPLNGEGGGGCWDGKSFVEGTTIVHTAPEYHAVSSGNWEEVGLPW